MIDSDYHATGGLSPPTRGSHLGLARSPATMPTVYPRPRGGAQRRRPGRWSGGAGLSPPTRGSRHRAAEHRGLAPVLRRVYPRPRGGAGPTAVRPTGCPTGVYPRPRGGAAVSQAGVRLRRPRSIPAHAGEPVDRDAHPRHERGVYPRPRGGASRIGELSDSLLHGLSPPTRGSLANRGLSEPIAPQVYPRPRGGAWSAERVANRDSRRVYPRPRGGATCTAGRPCGSVDGSIPAHAGEPTSGEAAVIVLRHRVYPRPRGGAVAERAEIHVVTQGVYPRPRGGAERDLSRPRVPTREGLSPPTRGSRRGDIGGLPYA